MNREERGAMSGSVIKAAVASVLACVLLAGCAAEQASTQPQQGVEATQQSEDTKNQITAEGQSIGLTSVGNARELGGYVTTDGKTIRRGSLLRTAVLSGLSKEDERRLTDTYGIATIVDFRMTPETEQEPEISMAGVKGVSAHIIDESEMPELDDQSADEQEGDESSTMLERIRQALDSGMMSDQMYVDWLSSKTGKSGYRTFFDELEALPEGRSLLFHCTQGKDRTGVAAMLILSVLGVDEDTIMQDFLLTNEFNADLIAQDRKMLEDAGIQAGEFDLYLAAMDQASEQTMRATLDWLKENYGSPAAYAKQELGITAEQVQALKDKFLE